MCVWWTRISLCAPAEAAELQHGDIKHPQEEHQRHLWQPEDAQEERQRERAHHAGQEGVAGAVAGQLVHGVIGAAVHVDDDDGAVGGGTSPQPGHAAHLENRRGQVEGECDADLQPPPPSRLSLALLKLLQP